MDFITGKAVTDRWKIERYELMKFITSTAAWRCGDVEIFNEKLVPYSPAYFKPYEVYLALDDFIDETDCDLMINETDRMLWYKEFQKRGNFSPLVMLYPGDIYQSLDEVLFDLLDVEAFEALHFPKLRKKGRISNHHSEQCREVAKKLWEIDKSRTIQDLITCDEMNSIEGVSHYTEKTLRNWIKDLCPNPAPGRRTKTAK
jgi:hypothetical protein